MERQPSEADDSLFPTETYGPFEVSCWDRIWWFITCNTRIDAMPQSSGQSMTPPPGLTDSRPPSGPGQSEATMHDVPSISQDSESGPSHSAVEKQSSPIPLKKRSRKEKKDKVFRKWARYSWPFRQQPLLNLPPYEAPPDSANQLKPQDPPSEFSESSAEPKSEDSISIPDATSSDATTIQSFRQFVDDLWSRAKQRSFSLSRGSRSNSLASPSDESAPLTDQILDESESVELTESGCGWRRACFGIRGKQKAVEGDHLLSDYTDEIPDTSMTTPIKSSVDKSDFTSQFGQTSLTSQKSSAENTAGPSGYMPVLEESAEGLSSEMSTPCKSFASGEELDSTTKSTDLLLNTPQKVAGPDVPLAESIGTQTLEMPTPTKSFSSADNLDSFLTSTESLSTNQSSDAETTPGGRDWLSEERTGAHSTSESMESSSMAQQCMSADKTADHSLPILMVTTSEDTSEFPMATSESSNLEELDFTSQSTEPLPTTQQSTGDETVAAMEDKSEQKEITDSQAVDSSSDPHKSSSDEDSSGI